MYASGTGYKCTYKSLSSGSKISTHSAIDLNNIPATIYYDEFSPQNRLTAGDGIKIEDDVISVAKGLNVKLLGTFTFTYDDEDWVRIEYSHNLTLDPTKFYMIELIVPDVGESGMCILTPYIHSTIISYDDGNDTPYPYPILLADDTVYVYYGDRGIYTTGTTIKIYEL